MKSLPCLFLLCIAAAFSGCGGTASNSASSSSAVDPSAFPKPVGEVDADAPTEFTTTNSGLKYRILRKSDGAKPTAANQVTVNYKGWLDNGNEFDSSYGSGPITFPLGGVIPGWTEGMQLVGEGGMIELEIPSDLGYGPSGTGGIPPNSTLHFYVELIKVH